MACVGYRGLVVRRGSSPAALVPRPVDVLPLEALTVPAPHGAAVPRHFRAMMLLVGQWRRPWPPRAPGCRVFVESVPGSTQASVGSKPRLSSVPGLAREAAAIEASQAITRSRGAFALTRTCHEGAVAGPGYQIAAAGRGGSDELGAQGRPRQVRAYPVGLEDGQEVRLGRQAVEVQEQVRRAAVRRTPERTVEARCFVVARWRERRGRKDEKRTGTGRGRR